MGWLSEPCDAMDYYRKIYSNSWEIDDLRSDIKEDFGLDGGNFSNWPYDSDLEQRLGALEQSLSRHSICLGNIASGYRFYWLTCD